MRRTLFASILAVLMSAAVAVPSYGANSASIMLTPPGTFLAASAWPRYGDAITFTVTYPKQLDRYGVKVQVVCFQDGNMVWATSGTSNSTFLLGDGQTAWSSNQAPASCVADLYYWSSTGGGTRVNWLATTQFDAAGLY